MGYPTKVQVIRRQSSEQWYVNFPVAVAQVIEFQKGEVVEWALQDKNTLVLKRVQAVEAATSQRKKNNEAPAPSVAALGRRTRGLPGIGLHGGGGAGAGA
jgi:hypothetical protein